MDAVLGAAALGDIGVHFPPEDPTWAGADSTALARRVASLVRDAGWEIVNLDLTLLAERPRIRGRLEEMRRTIADAFGSPGIHSAVLDGELSNGRLIAGEATMTIKPKKLPSPKGKGLSKGVTP